MSEREERAGTPGPEEDSLAARLRRLEEILGRLEAEDVELEHALELFEEGIRLVKEAERTLSETQLRVQELLEDGSTRELPEGDETG